MTKVLVTESNLSAIASAIRSKLGVETTYKPGEMAAAIASIEGGYPEPTGTVSITQNGTANVKNYAQAAVNVPNSYVAADEGKVVSNGALVSQTSRTVTENGTIDTTLNNSLTVNVSGGGGGGVDLSYLPNSTAENVIVSQDNSTQNDVHSESWGEMGFIYTRDAEASKNADGLLMPIGVGLRRKFSDSINRDVTIYICAARLVDATGQGFVLGVPNAMSSGNDPLFFTHASSNKTIYYSVWGGDTSISGTDSTLYNVYAISVNGTSKKARFFLNGVYIDERSFTNSGKYVTMGGPGMPYGVSNYDSAYYIKYAGVVTECEGDADIIANMQTIMTKLGLNA